MQLAAGRQPDQVACVVHDERKPVMFVARPCEHDGPIIKGACLNERLYARWRRRRRAEKYLRQHNDGRERQEA